MRLEIVSREAAHTIDPVAWDELAANSKSANPFYERYALLPALQFLQTSSLVQVVVAYEDNKLIALFPILGVRRRWGVKVVSFWKHDHCFITDPLCSQIEFLPTIIEKLFRQLKVSVLKVDEHSQHAFGAYITKQMLGYESTRGCVFQTNQIEEHLNSLPQKLRMENKRILNRINKNLEGYYVTSTSQPERDWLTLFCNLEHSGWKKVVGGSILSRQDVHNYYRALIDKAIENKRVEFQGVFNVEETLALSFRMISNGTAFELKTTYNEKYRKFSPGVALELFNLQAMDNYHFKLIDSCANAKVVVVNRLWPDKRKICNSIYFRKDSTGLCLKLVYRFKRWYHAKPSAD